MDSIFALGLFQNIGMMEILLILVAVLLIFGAGRIKKTMQELGGGISSFKKGMREGEEELKKTDNKNKEKEE